jgi:transcriptional repressor NrdR
VRCPQCGSESRQAVKETRSGFDGRITRRRRCPDCGHRFQTTEQLSETGLQVRKADGRVTAFVRDSIRTSIRKAAVREFARGELEELVDGVSADVYPLSDVGPIPTRAIADAVLRRLRDVDPATHIRFALVHAGRQDRDTHSGWRGIDEVRRWLVEEYPQLQNYRPPSGLAKVVKRDGRLVPFDRTKLERGIGVASKGRGTRSEVRQLATDVAEDVENAIGDQPVVTTGQIASEILRSLRARDDVAYLRFASTAKKFATPEAYEAEAIALAKQAIPSRREEA